MFTGPLLSFACPMNSFTLFQKRKPGNQNQWSEKLPDFVKRLEAALFNSAATKARSMCSVGLIVLIDE
jgi:hypothetical protein